MRRVLSYACALLANPRRLLGGDLPAANSPGRSPGIGALREQPLGHEVLLGVASVLAGTFTIALELPLEGGHDSVEGEARRGGHELADARPQHLISLCPQDVDSHGSPPPRAIGRGRSARDTWPRPPRGRRR